MNIMAIIQARMGSTRLPGKMMAMVAGEPLIWHVVHRVRQAQTVDEVVLATSSSPRDDVIAQFCRERDIACYRGSENDLLDRFYQASKEHRADAVVRVCGDCPLIDAGVIDLVVKAYQQGDYDLVSNALRYSFPDGLDAEIFSFAALEQAWREAGKASEREHVTPYIKLSGKFRIHYIENEVNLAAERHHWSVDSPEDLEFVRLVFENFTPRQDFWMDEILDLMERRPELRQINSQAVINEGYYRSLYQQARPETPPRLPLEQSRSWLARSQKVIPGCAQTFSKGYTQYVQGISPIFLQRGKGCRVWDVDGSEYIDYVQGLLPNILGYAHDEVNAAVQAQLAQGHSFSLPHPLEVELAERLVRLIPCAEMVRFGKNGSDATAGAVRAARAFTGRDLIACCGYHGWQDWYIGSTTRNLGVPQNVRSLTHSFPYNDLLALEKLLQDFPGQFAAVIMEPVNYYLPSPGYLAGVQELAVRHGALLIFDEICTGFHLGLGGAQKRYGVIPDLACFGKAMANGFPISCVLGRGEIMKIFEEIFFSFTFAGEVASMAAAMKVLDILESTDALDRMAGEGQRLMDGFQTLAREAGLEKHFMCLGHPTWNLIRYLDGEGKESFLVRSLFQQETVKRGILLNATHNLTAAHTPSDIDHTLEVYATVFKTLTNWLSDNSPARFLEGVMVEPVFRVR